MNQIYVGGHSIAIKGDKLIIDGNLVDVKLKRSLFGGLGGISTISTGSIIQTNGKTVMHGSAMIKIGKNTIVVKGDQITVNGEEVDLCDEKSGRKKTLEEQLNEGAKKYLISTAKEDEIKVDGEVCRRIVAMEDIVDKRGNVLVKKGEKGGYVARRSNLSEEGTCWIYDDAVVRQDAEVSDDARVSNKADVYENSNIGGKSQISGKATVHGNVSTGGNVEIGDNADVHGNVAVGGNVKISGKSDVHGNVSISGNVEISENANVHGNISLGGNVRVSGDANLHGNIALSGNEVITNNKQVEEIIGENASIIIKGSGSSIINLGSTKINGSVLTYNTPTKKPNDEQE